MQLETLKMAMEKKKEFFFDIKNELLYVFMAN